MNKVLLESLLNDNEGSALDFKEQQYPFEGATDDEKAELLKDILAFANSWRQGDAHILIGVREIKGGRSVPVGIPKHLDDAKLQQFVNAKLNRSLTFSYRAIPFGGVQIGVISIHKQIRPFFLVKDYGKLKQSIVYYRQGSSTAQASPDDIIRMGSADDPLKDDAPTLELQLCDLQKRKLLGKSATLKSVLHDGHVDLPDYSRDTSDIVVIGNNRDYLRELAVHVIMTRLLSPISFALKHTSGPTARDVRVEIELPIRENLFILDEASFPRRPSRTMMPRMHSPSRLTAIQVDLHGDTALLSAQFGKVQPGATSWSTASFYVGAMQAENLDLEATVFDDSLRTPIKTRLSLSIEVESRPPLTLKDLTSEDE